MINLKKLQNGSDIRGVAMEGVVGEPITLDETISGAMGAAFISWLSTKTGKPWNQLTIAIGHDSRITAPKLKNALIDSISSMGVHVFDCGLSSTPSMFMSTIFPEFACQGAIMITASHLPFNRNGFKFFDKSGGLDKGDISQLITLSENFLAVGFPKKQTGKIIQADIIASYSDFLKEKIKTQVNHPTHFQQPLLGLKIIVDAGNGAGGFYATQVLEPLGAVITGSQFLDPDGTFPNHIPNPEDKTAMASISKAVKVHHADFGLIFDTDVDRSSAVDKFGHEINRNAIVALAAALVAETHPGTTIVTDSVTSDQLSNFIEGHLGCVHHRFKRGYKNVINESIRLNKEGTDSQLAIETSGHAALKENYFLDDGAYLATKIVIKAAKLKLEGKTLDRLIEDLEQPAQSKEIRIPILTDQFAEYGDKVISDLELFAHVGPGMRVVMPNYEGVRIAFDKDNGNGWCLLRKSLHDPIMPLNMESNSPHGCEIIAGILKNF
ncbi:MAG: phosphomannomutase/phosphoglucomutase, partial [Anaerovorax sp.]